MPRPRNTRLAREVLARQLRSTQRAENAYARGLRAVLGAMHQAFMAYLEPRLGDVAMKRDTRVTRHTIDLQGLEVHILKQVPGKTLPLFDRMANDVDKANANAQSSLIGITPANARIGNIIAAKRDENIRLVENAGRVYAQQVRDVFENPDNYGLRVEELRDMLLTRGNVSESRAELIARDQTLKLNGQITEARQTAAGVTQYIWSTSGDERVRETHEAHEGETFDWSSPPIDTGHPGQDFQCRCVALPVLDEFAGIDEPEAREEAPAEVRNGAAGALDTVEETVNDLGVVNSEYLREGMRDLSEHKGAFSGATPDEVNLIATGRLPAKNSGKVLPPITIVHDQGDIILRDGRHRMTAALQAGASEIRAVVKTTTRSGRELARETSVSLRGRN